MSIKQPFAPRYNSTVAISATTTAAPITIKKGNKQWRIINKGTSDIFVYAYDSVKGTPRAATTADFPVLAGQATTITVFEEYDTLSHITATGTATGYVTPGEGW